MPQNNQDIVSSPEFKEFVKENNLDVMNLESMQVALFASCHADRYLLERVEQLEKRLMEVWKEIKLDNHPESDVFIINEPKTLADKWK